MKIIYFADGPWAHQAFDRILDEEFEILLMVLRYETRDEVLQNKAKEQGIDFTWVEDVNGEEFIAKVKSLKAEIGVSMSFNQIFKQEILSVFPKGLINCHAGKLPLYRGRNVLNWALINGENEIGVTCHFVDEGIDSGDIILQKTFPVTRDDNYRTILDKAYNMCPDVLTESMLMIRDNEVQAEPQQDAGTYYISRKEGDEFIDWKWSSEKIFNFTRAITTPGPCARTWIEYQNEYHLVLIREVKSFQNAIEYQCINGAVVGKSESGNPLVKTGDTYVEITDYEIIHHEKKRMAIGNRLGINPNLMMILSNKSSKML